MSWFKTRPRIKEHSKPRPEKSSPMTEQLLKETKIKAAPKQESPKKK